MGRINENVMDKVKVSIIIPVYNAEEYLDRCIHSVLDQEFHSFEVILIDDGSTDASPLICDRYSGTDARFITLHQKNSGVSAARNAGLNLAQGEYIMFLDADDALMPYALEDLFNNVAGEDIVVGGYGVFIEGIPSKDVRPDMTLSYKGGDYPKFFNDNIRKNCEMLDAPWAKLFRRKAIGKLRFCEDLSYAEDKLFVFEMLARSTSALTVSSPVYSYYIHAGSLGSDITSDNHLKQLRRFLPMYSSVLAELVARCPSVDKVGMLYHNDVVGRYLCRILNLFATRRSEMMTEEYVGWVYGMMDQDKSLGVFSLRFGQIVNILLYKIGKPSFTMKVYRFTCWVNNLFKKK